MFKVTSWSVSLLLCSSSPSFSTNFCLKLEGNVRICSSCSFSSVDAVLPEVQALPLALSLSPVKWDLFPALSALSHSLLSVSIPTIPGDQQSVSRGSRRCLGSCTARCPCAAGSIPAPGAGHPDSRHIGPGAAACCQFDSRRAPSVQFAVICHRAWGSGQRLQRQLLQE